MPDIPRPKILCLNAGLNGATGNTAVLLAMAGKHLAARADVSFATLASGARYADLRSTLEAADALVLGTGTHWDSWSHLLQRFFEEATPDEGTPVWLAKPAGVLVTMHSVGGKAVLSRLQGVLNTFGCLIPPMSGLVYSRVNQAAVKTDTNVGADLWSPEDVAVVCHNLLVALGCEQTYTAWPTDRREFNDRWIDDPET